MTVWYSITWVLNSYQTSCGGPLMISGLCYWNKAVNSLVLVSLCTRTAVSRIYAKENFFHIYYPLWSSHLELETHDPVLSSFYRWGIRHSSTFPRSLCWCLQDWFAVTQILWPLPRLSHLIPHLPVPRAHQGTGVYLLDRILLPGPGPPSAIFLVWKRSDVEEFCLLCPPKSLVRPLSLSWALPALLILGSGWEH